MASVACKEPGCPCTIDTTLYCKDVTSWLRLYSFLQTEKDQSPIGSLASQQIEDHLSLVKLHLKVFKIKNENEVIKTLGGQPTSPSFTTKKKLDELYLTCSKGHSYYYEVDCNP